MLYDKFLCKIILMLLHIGNEASVGYTFMKYYFNFSSYLPIDPLSTSLPDGFRSNCIQNDPIRL